ncbi:uncharacterized protein DUF4129 [Prauserella shujinwangii]|uniref:Uncharacterized protein DUF4129 n=1 Tax=Prauserella shujinwangii TaxID=1453103 RepID=A0A2T0LME9_9PSEU|nr:DUF4129 domain-containing protein [Prauserella shujinwangii]PRX44182.1 uncharacterized protein DUF4129 [Prauserella shujinwangii]
MPLADVPVDIGRDDARRAARAELADPAYADAEPSPLAAALRWVGERLADLFALAGSLPGGPAAVVVLVGLVLALVVLIRLRVGRTARHRARRAGAVFAGRARSAADHRLAAEQAFGRGDLAESVRERFRAIVRSLEERGLVDERPGRTADEAAAEAARVLPVAAEELRAAARRFDAVHYGGLPAGAEDYRRLTVLDETLAGSRPAGVP